MKKARQSSISIEIDKLTNSIENTKSGDIFDTELIHLTLKNSIEIKKNEWQFEWQKEVKFSSRKV